MKHIKHQQPYVEKIYLYVKDPFGSMYQLLINEEEKVEMEHLKLFSQILNQKSIY